MINIKVNTSQCIGCKKCEVICPTNVFTIENRISVVTKPDNCINCGHCVAICPKDAITHELISEDSIKSISKEDLPSSLQLMNLLEYRRSNRSFTKKNIPQDKIDLIIKAAFQAPTAENNQLRSISVITDPEEILKLTEFTISTFEKSIKPVNNFLGRLLLKPFKPEIYSKIIPSVLLGRKEYNEGRDMILRGATTVILFHDSDTNFGDVNSQLAYQNASLMAETLEISQFYTGFLIIANRKGDSKKLASITGNNSPIFAAMALGIPRLKFKKGIIRNIK